MDQNRPGDRTDDRPVRGRGPIAGGPSSPRGPTGGLADAELLERFASRDAGAAAHAFEGLLLRHGPMVLDVCRRVLGDPHDAEDAFQATFLVLAARADRSAAGRRSGAGSTVWRCESPVGPGPDAARRRAHERRAAEMNSRVADLRPRAWLRPRLPRPARGGRCPCRGSTASRSSCATWRA